MRPRAAHIVVVAALFAALCGCGRPARVIPAEKLTRIYHDMFLADQWLRDNSEARKVADTTLFFDPIFRKHGYTFEDYDRSVQYYLDHPEQYTKILNRAADRLRKEGERMQKAADELTARQLELDRFRKSYERKDFSSDSLRWAGIRSFWPAAADTTAVADTVAVADTTAVRDSAKVFWAAMTDSLRARGVPDSVVRRVIKNRQQRNQ